MKKIYVPSKIKNNTKVISEKRMEKKIIGLGRREKNIPRMVANIQKMRSEG